MRDFSSKTHTKFGVDLRDPGLAARLERFAAATGRTRSNAVRFLLSHVLSAVEVAQAEESFPVMDDADAARAAAAAKFSSSPSKPKSRAVSGGSAATQAGRAGDFSPSPRRKHRHGSKPFGSAPNGGGDSFQNAELRHAADNEQRKETR